jgi:ATP-dependent Zn protease
MNRQIRVAIIFFGILYLSWWWLGTFDNGVEPLPVTYSQFATEFDNVDNFHLLSDGREFMYTLKGDDLLVYKSTLPPGYSAKVIPEMIAQGASVQVDPPPKAGGMGALLLMSILPVLLLIGALVWMSRRAGGAAAAMGWQPRRL